MSEERRREAILIGMQLFGLACALLRPVAAPAILVMVLTNVAVLATIEILG